MITCFRVLELEKKKEQIVSKVKQDVPESMNCSSSSSSEDEEFPEFLDWRAKNAKGQK